MKKLSRWKEAQELLCRCLYQAKWSDLVWRDLRCLLCIHLLLRANPLLHLQETAQPVLAAAAARFKFSSFRDQDVTLWCLLWQKKKKKKKVILAWMEEKLEPAFSWNFLCFLVRCTWCQNYRSPFTVRIPLHYVRSNQGCHPALPGHCRHSSGFSDGQQDRQRKKARQSNTKPS